MCGIIGMVGQTKEDHWAETHHILSHLFLAAEMRGPHATGFVAKPESLEGRVQHKALIAKEAVKASVFIERSSAWRALRHRRCSIFLGHVRWATHGSPANPVNNHPHSSGGLHLVHNGILVSYRDLIDRYGLQVVGASDSEVLLRVVERAHTVPYGLVMCLHEKPGAIAVYDEQHNCVWLARDESRPLWIARMRDDKRLWIASTSAILLDGMQAALQKSVALEFLIPLASDYVYQATPDGGFGAVFEEPINSAYKE